MWLGLIGFALYNYAFYLFGAALNAFLPVYVVAVVLAATVLVVALSQIDAIRFAHSVRPTAPVRLLGGSLAFIAVGLASAWIAMWAAYVFAGRPTPVEPEAFKLVAALDLSLMVPALGIGGVLLWRRRPWGLVISAIASVQSALYLLVLSVNSVVSIHLGLTNAPGELPIWGTLTLIMGTVALGLFASVRSERGAGFLRRDDGCNHRPVQSSPAVRPRASGGSGESCWCPRARRRMSSPPIAVAGCIHEQYVSDDGHLYHADPDENDRAGRQRTGSGDTRAHKNGNGGDEE